MFRFLKKSYLSSCVTTFCTISIFTIPIFANQTQFDREHDLVQKIQQLENDLANAQLELSKIRKSKDAESHGANDDFLTRSEPSVAPAIIEEPVSSPERTGIVLGPVKIAGAMRANYTIGDYPDTPGPSRGSKGGNFELDTFRINAELKKDSYIGSLEYRWYNGYNFFHHVWLGYEFSPESHLEAGLTRVPFGPTAYGISQSWFFDLHYYVGLADDMDLGLKYTHEFEDWTLDIGYFPSSEWNGNGTSVDSARYSYDVVRTPQGGYDEEHQFNVRAVYHFDIGGIDTDLGASAQFGLLRGNHVSDGNHMAGSLHMVNRYEGWKLSSQITRYEYYLDGLNLVPMGAYDYAADVAAKAWVAGTSLSYHIDTKNINWLDSVTPYIEYSIIMKDKKAFNDSEMFIVGAAWASGGWYIYTDLAFSNGNYFVGNKGDFGENINNQWQTRFNINFGYYF